MDYHAWIDMILFWNAYRPWLAARGNTIFELRGYSSSETRWAPLPPPPQSTLFPYAVRGDSANQTDSPLLPLVSVSQIAHRVALFLLIGHVEEIRPSSRRAHAGCYAEADA